MFNHGRSMPKAKRGIFPLRMAPAVVLVLSLLGFPAQAAHAGNAPSTFKLVQCDSGGVVTDGTEVTGVNLPFLYDSSEHFHAESFDVAIFSGATPVRELDGFTTTRLNIGLGAVTNYDYDASSPIVYEIKFRGHYGAVGAGTAEITEEWRSSGLYMLAWDKYAVTASTSAGGSLDASTSSPQFLGKGTSTSFKFNADAGYYVGSASGCNGTAYNDIGEKKRAYTYETGPITADCTVSATFAIDTTATYTVTPYAGAGGSFSPATSQTVHGGDTMAFTAAANTGYHVASVSGCGGTEYTNNKSSVTTYAYTTGRVTADCQVTGQFALNTYTLTYTAGANGSISGVSPQTVSHGSSGTAVEAVPATGYHFVQWSDGSTANPRTDTNVAGNISVTASFAVNTYTLTYTAGANGSISGVSPQTVSHGSSGTAVEAVSSTGYHFVQWSDGSTANPRTDTNVTGSITVTATFAVNTYTLTYTAGDHGSIAGTSPQTVAHGSSGTAVTAVPDSGYHFVEWSDDSTVNPRTDANVTGDINVTASFNTGVVIHVDAASSASSPDGSSWSMAYKYLQDALAASASGNEIWVAKGVYYPDEGAGKTDNNRSSTFALKAGVAVYGGFAGGEARRSDRDAEANQTVLSGDLDKNDSQQPIVTNLSTVAGNTTNAYHVVTGADGATLDGFTITAGYYSTGNGGGVFNRNGALTLSNCTLSGNFAKNGGAINNEEVTLTLSNCALSANSAAQQGGGLYNIHGAATFSDCTFSGNSSQTEGGGLFNESAAMTMTNCTFSGNSANTDGGGVANASGALTMTNCVLSGNSAEGRGGGLVNNSDTQTLILTNCMLSANSADTDGGGVANASGALTMTNCTFSGNSGHNGGGLGVLNGAVQVTNSIFRDDSAGSSGPEIYIHGGSATVSHSNVEGCGGSGAGWVSSLGTDGGGNIDSDPKFISPGSSNYRLQLTSPCKDAGDNDSVPHEVTTDLDGNQRIKDTTVDMGAYEARSAPSTVTASAGANGSLDGSTPSPQHPIYGYSTDFRFNADTGYHVASVSGCNGEAYANSDNAVVSHDYATGPVVRDCSVTASFATNGYTLTYTAGANGSISGVSPQTVSHGSSGTAVEAVSATGYHFVQWSDGSTANPRTDTNVTGNISVTASFAVNTYILTYTAGANGSISGVSPQTVSHGLSGTAVEAVPATGYHFVQWSDGSTANPRTDTNVTGDITVSATFAINTYTVTPDAGAGGSLSPPEPQTVSYGSMTSFTVIPATGYRTSSVSGCGGSLSGTLFTTGAITADCTVTATFGSDTAPVASADSYDVDLGHTVSASAPGVLRNDTDTDCDALCAVLVSGPTHQSTFTFNANGGFTYTHDGTNTGNDSFTYEACDPWGGHSAAATVTLVVHTESEADTELTVAPSSRLFGVEELNNCDSSTPVLFTVKNSGTTSRTLDALYLGGPAAGEFELVDATDGCSNQTLAAGATCTVAVKFCPQSTGSKAADLLIPSDDLETPVLAAFLYNHESRAEESRRRLPPVLYSLNVPDEMTEGGTYSLTWSLLGYDESYLSNIVFFDCTGITDGTCGDSYESHFRESGNLSPDGSEPGDWTYNGVRSKKFNFHYDFTAPSVDLDTEIVIRFYSKDRADADAGNGSLSLIIPGNLSLHYYDNEGRRLLKAIKNQ